MRFRIVIRLTLLVATFSAMAGAQAVPTASAVVPQLVNFSGVLTDLNGKPLTGTVGVTFVLYKEDQGGVPLWLETQNVQPDKTGHYKVMLGSTSSTGLPTDIFVAGEARWLGVQTQGQPEQPRVMLLSVPYALKAGDAATVGGLPPSAFVLAAPPSSSATPSSAAAATPSAAPPAGAVTGSGTVNFLPLWTSTSNIGNSVLFQSGTGSTVKLGINTTTPASTLDVKGAGTVRGTLNLPATATATAAKGANSQPLDLAASAFSSAAAKAVNQTFQWQAEPAGNNTSTPSGTLNLLFGSGTSAPAETGLKVANNGQIAFATGQTFPGTGTVASVASGAGLTGGPITSSGTLSIATAGVTNAMLANPSLTVSAGTGLSGGGPVVLGASTTLNLDTAKVPLLAASNSFTGNQSVAGNITATGNLGVGTTTPATVLDVFSSTVGTHTPIAQFGSKGKGDSNSILAYNGTGVTEMFQSGFPNAFVTGSQAGDGGLRVNPGKNILFGDSSGTLRMQITSGGTAVIASSTPTVIGNITGCGGAFGGVGFGAASLADCAHYSLLGDTVNTYLNRPPGGAILFRESNATEMVLAPGGNLGIGTTAPQFPLHVNGIMRSETGLSLGGNALVAVDAPGIVGGHFTVLPNGNVGIGTATPTNTLDIRGGLTINSDTPMTSNPHMSFSTMFVGSLCNGSAQCGGGSGSSWGAFVPDRNILITRITITLNSAIDPSCTPASVIVSANGTRLGSVTLPGNTYFVDSGALSMNALAGAPLSVFPDLNPDNCNLGASAGGDVYMNTQYVMR